ncbi:MAG: hypothetical protein U5L96_12230 [Owenweeksia sp.]|nr:hypothetical protein [Owenweeksia sp.]
MAVLQSLRLPHQNFRQHPDFKPTYIPLGVLNAAIGSLPEDYRSLASLLGFEGSVSRGMALLSGAYSKLSADPNTQFYNSYAGFVYSFVSFQLDPGSSVSPHSLGLPVGSSSFLIYLQARIELAKGRPLAAAKWLAQRPSGDRYQSFHYLNYLQGKVLLGLEPDQRPEYFWRYIRQSKNELYLKSSYRYLSWYYLLARSG